MGKKKLTVIPEEYWSMIPAQPSEDLIAEINESV